jgi:hypothetical protein
MAEAKNNGSPMLNNPLVSGTKRKNLQAEETIRADASVNAAVLKRMFIFTFPNLQLQLIFSTLRL